MNDTSPLRIEGSRQREIGIRMALGAQGRDIVRMVLAQGMFVVLVGVGLGLAGALMVARLLAGFLYGVSPSDGIAFAGVSALLGVAALVACYIPARRAARLSTIVALRYE